LANNLDYYFIPETIGKGEHCNRKPQ